MISIRNLALVIATMCLALPYASHGADPQNESECLSAMQGPIEMQCQQLFAEAGTDQIAQCLAAAASQIQTVCKQFFGPGQNFCTVCTGACTDNFQPNTERRKSCLQMCLTQPGCS